jgi:hypothetical protein
MWAVLPKSGSKCVRRDKHIHIYVSKETWGGRGALSGSLSAMDYKICEREKIGLSRKKGVHQKIIENW